MKLIQYRETQKQLKRHIVLFVLMGLSFNALSQNPDSTKAKVSGAVSITNNGVSLVPAFSLGNPAAIFDVAIRKKRFSFEPQMAFSVKDATPWYLVFWLRYKAIETSKFNMRVGFHPGFLFDAGNQLVNGVDEEHITTSRFFVGELAPNYVISKDVSVGVYYQHSRGFTSLLRKSHFLGINAGFSDIRLGTKFYMKAAPQVYYLKNDDKEGFYVTSTIALARRGFPVSVSTLLNRKLRSDIPSDDFLWNVMLTYSF